MASSAPSPATGLFGVATSTEATAHSDLLGAAPSREAAPAHSGLFGPAVAPAFGGRSAQPFARNRNGSAPAIPPGFRALSSNTFPAFRPTQPGFDPAAPTPFGAAPSTPPKFGRAAPSPFGAAPVTPPGFGPATPSPTGAAPATSSGFGPAITKNITISLEDRSKPNSNVMTTPSFTDLEQKLPILDDVAKYSFMMGEHKVTIQIDGPDSGASQPDGATTKIEDLLPKLSNAEYYTIPTIKELADKEKLGLGYLSRVRNFVVGRNGYGSIMFPDETDVRGLDLDSIVAFNRREVVLYPDGKTPPVGVGLNKPAVVTLLDVKYYDDKGEQFKNVPIVEKIKDLLMKTATENGAEFLSYDPALGVWKFTIQKK